MPPAEPGNGAASCTRAFSHRSEKEQRDRAPELTPARGREDRSAAAKFNGIQTPPRQRSSVPELRDPPLLLQNNANQSKRRRRRTSASLSPPSPGRLSPSSCIRCRHRARLFLQPGMAAGSTAAPRGSGTTRGTRGGLAGAALRALRAPRRFMAGRGERRGRAGSHGNRPRLRAAARPRGDGCSAAPAPPVPGRTLGSFNASFLFLLQPRRLLQRTPSPGAGALVGSRVRARVGLCWEGSCATVGLPGFVFVMAACEQVKPTRGAG